MFEFLKISKSPVVGEVKIKVQERERFKLKSIKLIYLVYYLRRINLSASLKPTVKAATIATPVGELLRKSVKNCMEEEEEEAGELWLGGVPIPGSILGVGIGVGGLGKLL
jgi:hypothetical protein